MSDFLAGALSAAKADFESKRSRASSQRADKLSSGERKTDSGRKQKSKWLSNPGAEKRARLESTSSSGLSEIDLQRSRKALERKEREYKRMFNKGTDMALTGDAAENLMVDFDRKWAEGHRQELSSEDEQNPLDEDEDPMIDIQDEFGRTRKIRKSEALLHEKPVVENERPQSLIYGHHIQRFNPDAEKKNAIWAEEEASREIHYDPNFDLRQRGTGYINLGSGQDRKLRMDNLKDIRRETVDVRQNDDQPVSQEVADPVPAAPIITLDTKASGYIHPSRKHQLHLEDDDDEAAKNAKRSQAGAAFLDNLL